MTNLDFLLKLCEISKSFDFGCDIHIGDDSISIEGVDYHPEVYDRGDLDDPTVFIHRFYHLDIKHNDVGEMEDTITPVLNQIARKREDKL